MANPFFWDAKALASEARALVEHLDGDEMYADVVVDGLVLYLHSLMQL